MAKRFTDTDKWKKSFLRGLDASCKLLWFYICDDCDHAGIWQVDMEVAEIRTGEKLDQARAIEMLNGKIIVFDDGKKWYIPSFIEFQYASGLNPSNKAHSSVLTILKRYHLPCPLYAPSIGAKDTDMDMDTVKAKPGKGSGENPKKKLKDSDETTRQNELKAEYGKLLESTEGKDDREVFKIIREFVNTGKPTFAEPFVDAWNIFAPTNNIPRVGQISQSRRDKIRIRTREPGFDFFKILSSIRQNGFYRGESTNGWKVDFNHVVESEDNYLKIIEKYRDN